MEKQILSQFDKPIFPLIALGIFLICFLAYAYWTFKKENRVVYENASLMPLDEGVKHE